MKDLFRLLIIAPYTEWGFNWVEKALYTVVVACMATLLVGLVVRFVFVAIWHE